MNSFKNLGFGLDFVFELWDQALIFCYLIGFTFVIIYKQGILSDADRKGKWLF